MKTARVSTCLWVACCLALSGVHAFAQGGFRVPGEGTLLPEVTVLDDQGRPFSTKTLREHYTVLVFGCLT